MNVIGRLMAMLRRRSERPDAASHEERERRVREAVADARRAQAVARRLEMEARVFAGSPRREDEP